MKQEIKSMLYKIADMHKHIHTAATKESIINKTVAEIMDKLAPPKIDWLPFPENKPEKSGQYLVTITINHHTEVREVYYMKPNDKIPEREWGWFNRAQSTAFKFEVEWITAYMPMPQPYKKPTT